MHHHRHMLYRAFERVRRFGFTVWTALLLLFLFAPVYAIFDGIGAGSAFVWAILLMGALNVWKRRSGGVLPAFFRDPPAGWRQNFVTGFGLILLGGMLLHAAGIT